jgi:phosphatidylglycerol lysyltransferase
MDRLAAIRARQPLLLVHVTALLTLGGGLVNLASLLSPRWAHERIFQEIFPLQFLHVSRLVSLVLGFALVVGSFNVYKRKRRAFYAVLVVAVLSLVFHLAKGRSFEQAIYSGFVILALVVNRNSFTVKSSTPEIQTGVLQLASAFALALAYGVAGFWLLDRRDFGINFTLPDAIATTVRTMLLMQNPELTPHTNHARWFLHSLDLMTTTAVVYSAFALFRPVVYRLSTVPRERHRAGELLREHGRCALDYFKVWPDKSLWVSPSQDAFVAYRVGASYAIALGDPVGSPQAVRAAIGGFLTFCQDNDWGAAFHQTLPDFLPLYREHGLHKLKIGDDAIVDLTHFSLDGKSKKSIRNTINQLEREGMRAVRYDPPLDDALLQRVQVVSDAWLTIPGRRERRFTLGWFDLDYVRSTPLIAVEGPQGEMKAFSNLIPSYCKGEATIDLMRHLPDAPGGTMDFLFVKTFEQCRDQGFTRFDLGMAPMSGFAEKEEATAEERAIHFFFQYLNALFSFRGLRRFKAKFATIWEPRYLVYRNPLVLPAVAIALRSVSELKRDLHE